MGLRQSSARARLGMKGNFLGDSDAKDELKDAFETLIKDQESYVEFKAFINQNEVLKNGVAKNLPEKYEETLEADGFFDIISNEEAEFLHAELKKMVEIPASE